MAKEISQIFGMPLQVPIHREEAALGAATFGNQMDMYCIKNNYLNVCIRRKGATLWSIQDVDKNEYLWQGNPEIWEDRAPNLFPYIARLTNGQYKLDGRIYEMDIHGFAKDMEFEVEQKSDVEIVFSLKDNVETYEHYPYKFNFSVSLNSENPPVSTMVASTSLAYSTTASFSFTR